MRAGGRVRRVQEDKGAWVDVRAAVKPVAPVEESTDEMGHP